MGAQYQIVDLAPDVLTVTRATPAGAWAGFPEVTSSAASIVLDQTELSGEWTNPYVACPDAEERACVSTRLSAMFFFGKTARVARNASL